MTSPRESPTAALHDGAPAPPWSLLDEARLRLYHALSRALSDPAGRRPPRADEPGVLEQLGAAAAFIAQEPSAQPPALAPGELPPSALATLSLPDWLDQPAATLAAQHERVFGLVSSKECPPYETEYCRQTFSVYRSQRLADVAGCYRAFGLQPSCERPERHDHLALELEFMAWLLVKQRHAGRLHGGGARRAGHRSAHRAGRAAARRGAGGRLRRVRPRGGDDRAALSHGGGAAPAPAGRAALAAARASRIRGAGGARGARTRSAAHIRGPARARCFPAALESLCSPASLPPPRKIPRGSPGSRPPRR